MSNKMNFGEQLRKRAELAPDIEAFVDVPAGRRLTYAELEERASRFAEAMTSQGLQPGDRIGVALPNGHQFAEIYYGAGKAGFVVVPLNLRLVADEVSFILQDSGASVLITGETHLNMAADLRSRREDAEVPVRTWVTVGEGGLPDAFDYEELLAGASGSSVHAVAADDALVLVMYTSGTAGRPKGTMHTHETLYWAMITVIMGMDLRQGDRFLLAMPMFHIAGFGILSSTLYRGGTLVSLPGFEEHEFWRMLRDERITCTLAGPPMLALLRDAFDPDEHQPLALRWLLTGTMPVPVDLIETFDEMGFSIYQAYGCTEAGGAATVLGPSDAIKHLGSAGKAQIHSELKIISPESGSQCAAGEPGEIVLRGGHMMVGYWNQPEQTAEAMRDGWFHTGDIGLTDGQGFLYVRDRLKDMIISGGENVYPAEIEFVLGKHPDIAEVAVVGVTSERWGESPMAIVVRSDPSLSERDVLDYCHGKLARFKHPKAVEFVETIPRNATGKALKYMLREQYQSVVMG